MVACSENTQVVKKLPSKRGNGLATPEKPCHLVPGGEGIHQALSRKVA